MLFTCSGSKFTPGSKLAEWLMATHPAQLQEGNTWNDELLGRRLANR